VIMTQVCPPGFAHLDLDLILDGPARVRGGN
jgi:hypothetical protein